MLLQLCAVAGYDVDVDILTPRTFAARGYRHGPLARARALIRWAIRRGYDGLPGLDADHVLGILEAR